MFASQHFSRQLPPQTMFINQVATGAGVSVTLKLGSFLEPTVLILGLKTLTHESRGQLQHI
eukprot:4009205-Pyramimonas_sp.AAC.1